MDRKLLSKLEKRKEEGAFRQLSLVENQIDFFSNDYLGLAREQVLIPTSKLSGATGSRLLSGNSIEADTCETQLAEFYKAESALVFSSGYDANLAFFSSIPQRGDTIIYDELVHASIRDGIRLSFANSFSFHHNDLEDLGKQLQSAKGTIYLVVESLYSMDGDMAPMKSIIELAEKFNAYVIVDEAHAVGVFGADGRGIIHARNFSERVFARIVTFGKAYGYHGAAILGSKNLKDYLINFARPFIYSTGLPPNCYSIIASKVLRNDISERQRQLHLNITYFREGFENPEQFPSEINSPIQIVQFQSIEQTLELANKLKAKGIFTKPILSPTVAKGKERIRICIHTLNTKEEIDLLRAIVLETI